MTPEKALHLGVDPAEVRIGSHPRAGGTEDWQAYVPDAERGRRVLTEGGLFKLTRWRATMIRLAGQ